MRQHLVRVLRRHVVGDGRNHLGGRGGLGLFRVDHQADGAEELGIKRVDVDVSANPLQRQLWQDTHPHASFDHGQNGLVVDGETERVGPNLVVVQRCLGVLVKYNPHMFKQGGAELNNFCHALNQCQITDTSPFNSQAGDGYLNPISQTGVFLLKFLCQVSKVKDLGLNPFSCNQITTRQWQ